jgi:hypothetical protein
MFPMPYPLKPYGSQQWCPDCYGNIHRTARETMTQGALTPLAHIHCQCASCGKKWAEAPVSVPLMAVP